MTSMTKCLLAILLNVLILLVSGCGSAVTIVTPGRPSNSAASTIYVAQQVNGVGPGSILEFSATANGSVQPVRVLTPPAALLALYGFTVDQGSGQVYVGGFTTTPTNTIYQFAPSANGSATPTETLSVSGGNPGEMVVDSTGTLYVGADAEIDVFSPATAIKPIRVISGPLTQLTEINGIALDAQGNVFVTNGLQGVGSVLVFSANASGNVAPIRTITGVGTAQFYGPSGIAIDATGNLYVASYLIATSSPAQPSSIFVFAPGTTGFGTPLNTITGPATGLAGVGSMQFDRAGNLYVLGIAPNYQPSVSVFSAGSQGNVSPIRSFTSLAWTGTGFGQIGLF